MATKLEPRNKLQILALMAHHAGLDAYNLLWAAKTARLNSKTEMMIAEACGSPNWFGFIYDHPMFTWRDLVNTGLDELKAKGYMQVSVRKARAIFAQPDIQRWCNISRS
jgi:hypothetical protein